jgi:serine/threonine protein phosphatase 1
MVFGRLFSNKPATRRGAPGWRAYAIGDVHGRLDLLDQLLEDIVADHRSRPGAKGLIVLLGDYLDRGPASAQVVERVRTLAIEGFKIVALAGNHEEVLLRILDGDGTQLTGWLTYGGAQALASYGVDAAEVSQLAPADAQVKVASAIPATHREFLHQLGDSFRFGNYLFVHAGIRPGIPLESQSLHDLRWIREPFLSDTRDHGMTVVHGHTISERVEALGSRIGIDTGAYASGRLTALAIEGSDRWLLDTVDGRVEAPSVYA